MMVWRYVAVPLEPSAGGTRQAGELAGASAADVRASLRRAGLQVLDVRPIRRGHTPGQISGWLVPVQATANRHLRSRRRPLVGEIYDSLATMLDAGVPLLGAVESVTGRPSRRARGRRRMLLEVRESLSAGGSLSEAMKSQPAWFDAAEIAMVAAGQHSGDLSGVLRSLATKHGRASQLTSKIASALSYPLIVLLVGLGVVAFLSTKTLPELTGILTDAGIQAPRLTSIVMGAGQGLVRFSPMLVMAGIFLAAVVLLAGPIARSRGLKTPSWPAWLTPGVMRQVMVAQAMGGLAAMARVGVPITECLRVLAPTIPGLGSAALRRLLLDAADRIERGGSIAGSLDDEIWFDDEMRRLIEIGEASGELPEILERLAERQERSAHRAIDRFVTLLEPAMILMLAVLVGLVVMAAILPLIRLQEVV